MAESIGTAYINVEVNADQMQAGLSTARRSVSDLSTQAQAEFNKLSAAQKRAATSALNYAGNIGKTRAEVRAFNAEQRIGGTLGREIAATIRAQEAAYRGLATSASVAANRIGSSALSARQLVQAQRQLPMQFTDIAVSLAAGQAPMMVLLQQGGQLKDTFGGAGAAMRAMGGYVAGLINPLTITAGAAAALGIAWHAAEKRMEGFHKAIILTGNMAGVTAEQLSDLAAEFDNLSGVTEGRASEALATVASTGRFTADQIELVTRAALQMESATGTAIDETIAKFAALGKDPVEALLKLHETENFLTEAQIRRIRELVNEGKAQDAATESMQLYADELGERTTDITENLGLISGAWKSIKDESVEAVDAMVSGMGRADRAAADAAKTLGGFFERLKNLGGSGPGFVYGLQNLFNPPAGETGVEAGAAPADRYEPQDWSGVRSRSSTTNNARDAERARREQDRAAEAERREAYQAAKEAMALRREEEEQLRRLIAAEDEANEKYLQLAATLSGPLAAAEYQHQQNLIEIDRLGQAAGRTSAEIAELKRLEGEAYEELVDKIERGSDSMTVFAEQAARNMQSDFADYLFDPFAEGADGMVDAFGDALRRLMAEYAASEFFKAMSKGLSGVEGDSWWAGLLRGVGGAMSGGQVTTNAKGGVYDSPSLSGYSGGVYNTPQFFAFAKGAGVFAEAGPEAIMPLSRGPDGKLGVQATGAGDPSVTINVHNAPAGTEVRRSGSPGDMQFDVLIKGLKNDIAGEIASGTGSIYAAQKNRFGLRDSV